MIQALIIDYYSDVLCVWAWIAQRRIDELNQTLGNKIELKHCYLDVFGDVPTKMNAQWQEKGGYAGFAAHVHESASVFEDATTNPKIWTEVRPATSANAHLVLKAVEIAYDKNNSIALALKLRTAFFVDAQDIGDLDTLYELAASIGLQPHTIKTCIHNGSAMAALMGDYQKSKQLNLKGSPSFVMDGGRQILYGNVGYRVLLANVEALLTKTENEPSWC